MKFVTQAKEQEAVVTVEQRETGVWFCVNGCAIAVLDNNATRLRMLQGVSERAAGLMVDDDGCVVITYV